MNVVTAQVLRRGGRRSYCMFRRKQDQDKCGVRITILGANGQVGQLAALMLKLSPLVNKLNLHDLTSTAVLAKDLNQICTSCRVLPFHGPLQLGGALKEAQIVLMMAGQSWKPGMSQHDLFSLNAGSVQSNCIAFACVCPRAFLGILVQPINSNVPLACEVLKKEGAYNPDRIIGMSTLDEITANSVVADTHSLDASFVSVPVIGGASERTAVPLLSHARPFNEFTEGSMAELMGVIRNAQTQVVMSKRGKGKPMLSTGYAAARFALNMTQAILGYPDVVLSAYVRSKCLAHMPYLTSPVRLGPRGIVANLGIPRISRGELALLEHALPEIEEDVARGIAYSKLREVPAVMNV